MTPLVAFTTALLALAVAILWPRVMQSLAGCLVVLVTFVASSLVTIISIIHSFWPAK